MAIKFLLKRDVREVWKKEDQDFTPWVAEIEPLTHLFSECGIDVGELDAETQIDTEVFIPGAARRLDVLVTLSSGQKIAIENQFSRLDHDHLTRALAYAVGLDVRTVIVLAEFHKDEFRSVVEYLNSAAAVYERGIKIFLVQFEVLSTPGSPDVYPNFELIEGPNEWKAAIESAQSGGVNAEMASLLYEFHDRALPVIRERTNLFTNVSPSKGHWKAGGLGVNGLQIFYGVAKEYCTLQIWFHGKSREANLAGYEVLLKHRSEIENLVKPFLVEWRPTDRTAIIEIKINDFGYQSELSEVQFEKLAKYISKLADFAKNHLGEIRDAMSRAITNELPNTP